LCGSSIEISRQFYEALGFESEGQVNEEFGLSISKLIGISDARIKTVKMKLKQGNDGIWREGGFRLELIEYLIPKSASMSNSNNNVIAKGHLCFTVKDILVSREKILELGGSSPFEIVLDETGKPIVAYFLDPDGIPLEFNISR